jgi:sec-independent protein translocase protein TatC
VSDSTQDTGHPDAPQASDLVEDESYRLAVVDLLGVLAYTELVAFERLAADASLAPMLTMSEQLSLVLAMILGFGIVFEVPVIIAFLALVGLVTADGLAKYRRYAIIGNVIAAAIITPTGDPINLAIMAVPMIVFYEIGIILARILGKKKPADAAIEPV